MNDHRTKSMAFSLVLAWALAAALAARAGSDEIATTPYTADQIRAGCPAGRRIRFEIEEPGQKRNYSVMEFVAVSDDSATIRTSTLGENGEPVGEPSEQRATWDGLRRHAAFPKTATTIEDATVTVPAGTFACKLYTVVTERDGKHEVRRFHFANELPGPPVQLVVEVDGKVVYRMTMLESNEVSRAE